MKQLTEHIAVGEEERTILVRCRDAVKAIDRSADIILYGSRARRAAQHDSDYDILIVAGGPATLYQEDKFLRVRTIPQMDEQGETRHLLELFEDITESRQAEESLRESERKFRMLSQEYHTLLDAIRNSIFLLSPDLKVV